MSSSNETQRELEEIEQLITIQLQGIDKNFAECCELMDKIIIDVDAYGVHTNTVLGAFEVWQHFFGLFEGVPSYVDSSIADTTSITNRPPLYDQTHSISTTSRSTPWNRRKRSLEMTPESRMRVGKKGFTTTFLSDTSSSTNQTDPFYSPPQTMPFGISQRELEGTPLDIQARIITDNNFQALSRGLDSDPSDDIESPKPSSPPRNIRTSYTDPIMFSPERSPIVLNKHSSALMGFASPASRSSRRTPLFKRPLIYNSHIINSVGNNSNGGEGSSRARNISNNSNNSTNNSTNNNTSNNNLWNDNILDKDNPEERERFNQFFQGRQRRSMGLNDGLPTMRKRIPSPTESNNSENAIPEPLIGSPTVLRVFDKERVDLRHQMQNREWEYTQERNNEKERDEPMDLSRETPERSTTARDTFDSPPVLQDDSPMRMTQDLDRFSPIRIADMEDVQHTPEAVPFFAQNLSYRPSPREDNTDSSVNTFNSNITMITGETDANIPATFNLKYFPDSFRTPPNSTLLTRVFNLFSERPGQMLTLDDVITLINDKSVSHDGVNILIDLLKRRKFLKPVGDGLAWTLRR